PVRVSWSQGERHHSYLVLNSVETYIPHGPLLIFGIARLTGDRFTAWYLPKTEHCCHSVVGRHCCYGAGALATARSPCLRCGTAARPAPLGDERTPLWKSWHFGAFNENTSIAPGTRGNVRLSGRGEVGYFVRLARGPAPCL